MIMKLILCKKTKIFTIAICRDIGKENKTLTEKYLPSQKVNDWLPKKGKIDGMGILIFPFNRIRGWRQNEWKLYPEKQCETRPSGI